MFGPTIDDFGGFLARQRHGALQDELSAALDSVRSAVAASGRPGAVTVELSIEALPGAQGELVSDGTVHQLDAGLVRVLDRVVTSLPGVPRLS